MTLQIYIGAQGCGKTTWITSIATEQQIIRSSDILKEAVKLEGLDWNHINAHRVGTKLLSKDRFYFAKIMFEQYQSGKTIVDGIKNPDEIDFLKRNCDNSQVVSLYCPRNVRYKRVIKRKRGDYPISREKFMERDENEILDVGLNKALFRSDYFVLAHHFNIDKDEIGIAAKNLFDYIEGNKLKILSTDVKTQDVQLEVQPIEKRYVGIQHEIDKLHKFYSRNMRCGQLFLEYYKLDEDMIRRYKNGDISLELLFS